MKNKLKERVTELIDAFENNNFVYPENLLFESDLITVFRFSDFIASTVVRHPAILNDLILSGDLDEKYRHPCLVDGEFFSRFDRKKVVSIYSARLADQMAALPIENEVSLKSLLTKMRMREMVRIAWRDLTGKADLDETLADLSLLAQACVEVAVSYLYHALCEKCGIPQDRHGKPQGLVVLGMGKLGAYELNFSSDIDLIFAYREEGAFHGGGRFHTVGEFFNRLCRNLVKLFDLSGGVDPLFRMDTRLRPFGGNGPIVMSFDAMEAYYQTQGREWERYALIKARPVAGDIDAGYDLLKILNPFVYRRYFDYGSFDSLREMKERIAAQVKDKKYQNNIKLGAGGIREIEFFGQMFQLIRGGVEPEFQQRRILNVLNLLVERESISADVAAELSSAYHFLRRTEHRLQEWQDQQTHDLPERAEERARLAGSMGFDDWDGFHETLQRHMRTVHGHFRHLFVSEDEDESDRAVEGEVDGKDRVKAKELKQQDLHYLWHYLNDPQSNDLSAITVMEVVGAHPADAVDDDPADAVDDDPADAVDDDPADAVDDDPADAVDDDPADAVDGDPADAMDALIPHLRVLADHPNTRKLTRNGRQRLDRLVPVLVKKVMRHDNPELILKRLVDLVITIERRTCYLSLLVERSDALKTLVTLASKSPWIITFLSHHPALLDELMDPATLYTPPDRARMEASLSRRMAHIPEDDFEFQLEELCIFKQVMTLRVAAADVSGNYPLMKVSDRLTDIAETVMAKVLEIAWHHAVKKYGVPDVSNEDGKRGVDGGEGQAKDRNVGWEEGLDAGQKEGQDIDVDGSPLEGRALQGGNVCALSDEDVGTSRHEGRGDDEYHHGPYHDPRLEGIGCDTPGFAAIAYGKLGGIELGYKSDLDMVFLHAGSHGYTQGGGRSIENIRFYTFLGQRIINALTMHTQAGTLYEPDMRLRPSGQSGMIVSHIDAFNEYVHHEAWTWEHQAIIRARPVAGDPRLMNRFNEIRKEILVARREAERLQKEVREMRERMRQEHLKPHPGMFDLKHGRGGIVDIEFLVQYLVLQHAADHHGLTRWTDNVRLIEALMEEDLLTNDEACLLSEGYLTLRQAVHHLNLQEKEKRISLERFEKSGDAIFTLFEKIVQGAPDLDHGLSDSTP